MRCETASLLIQHKFNNSCLELCLYVAICFDKVGRRLFDVSIHSKINSEILSSKLEYKN